MKRSVILYLIAGLCWVSACNKNGETPAHTAILENEVTAIYQGLYRHPCSGHWFKEVNGDQTFFAPGEWDAANLETGVPLQVTYELLPIEQLSCNLQPAPDNFRHIRILSIE
ncbi:MAG: hypothetical protein HUU01_11750 [Saprospiraceae bacterium]|nr:hypothetical protein [Saprospiraceae bacterium]